MTKLNKKCHPFTGLVPKRLYYPESTPEPSRCLETPVKKRRHISCEATTTSNGGSSEQDMAAEASTANPTSTPVSQALFNRKDTFLPTLSPMRRFAESDTEANSSTKRESAFNEDYRKVRESMTLFDLSDTAPRPSSSTAVFSATKAKTPSVSVASKSAKKSGSKSTSKKLKTPGTGQMRINEFVKRRLLR